MQKRNNLNVSGLQSEDSDRLMAAVAAPREYAQILTEINRNTLWDVLDFTRGIYGQLRQVGVLTITYYCDHFQSFPLNDCTWYVCSRASNSVYHVYNLERRKSAFDFKAWLGAIRSSSEQSSSTASGRN